MVRKKSAQEQEIVVKKFTVSEIDTGIRKLRRRVDEVNKLALDGVNYDDARVKTAEANIRETVRDIFGSQSPEFHDHEYHDIWHGGYNYLDGEPKLQGKFIEGIKDTVVMLEGLISRLKEKEEDLNEHKVSVEQSKLLPAKDSRRVFIVHGHDEEAKLSVARFIEKINLEPIILSEQPNQGRTIVEKFEAHADVAFAVVLLTPDDVGFPRNNEEQKRLRARQNVILELGYFVGRLSRSRVCALSKGSVEIPSDIHGVVYVPLDDGGGWKLKLATELKQVGIDVDLNLAVN